MDSFDTPKWYTIKTEQPDLHNYLMRLVAKLYSEDINSTEIGVLKNGSGLKSAIKAGYLIQTDNYIKIIDKEILAEYVIRHFSENKSNKLWSDVNKLSEELNEINNYLIRFTEESEGDVKVLYILYHEHNKDLLLKANEGILNNTNKSQTRNTFFYNFCRPFSQVLPFLHYIPRVLAKELNKIVEDQSTNYYVKKGVRELASRNKKLAKSLYKEFTRKENSVNELAIDALLTFSKFEFKTAHEEAKQFAKSNQIYLQKIGINVLSGLEYDKHGRNDYLDDTLSCLNKINKVRNADRDYILAKGYGNLLTYEFKEIKDAIYGLSCLQDKKVHNEIACILRRNDNLNNEGWFKKSFTNLVKQYEINSHRLRDLDYILSDYLPEDKKFTRKILGLYIENHKESKLETNNSIGNLFSNTILKILNNCPDEINVLVTEWFAINKPKFHLTATELLRYVGRHSNPLKSEQDTYHVELAAPTLKKVGEEKVTHILRRILGYVTHNWQIIDLLVSVLKIEKYISRFSGFVRETLIEYILYNYPREGEEYVNKKIENCKRKGLIEIKDILEDSLDLSNEYYLKRKKLPPSKELAATSEKRYKIHLDQRKRHAKMMKETKKNSAILGFIQETPLKYGKAFFSKIENNYTDPSTLGKHEFSFEPPRESFIDPVWLEYKRAQWRISGLKKNSD